MIHANRIGGGVPGRPGSPVGEGRSLIIVEAVRFDDPGGWTIDTSCMESTRTPFLMAHGMGIPVADATTAVRVLPSEEDYIRHLRMFDLYDNLPRYPVLSLLPDRYGPAARQAVGEYLQRHGSSLTSQSDASHDARP